jgi:Tfp pilus assembly protein PilX
LKLSQHGMASIIITMVTMVVISLIVLGFATISRREARKSLDQLQSTQAFYAAESGIEDARKVIRNWLDSPATAALPVPSKTNCTTNDPTSPSAYPTGGDMTIDVSNNIGYTCLQVDPAPESVEFDGIDSDSTVIPLTSTSGAIRRVEISWQANTSVTSLANCPANTDHKFSPQSGANAWTCEFGVMRVDLTPTNGILTRAGLSGSTYSGFFQPVNLLAGGSDNYTNVNQARLVAARCNTTGCKAIIDQIPGITSLSLRLSSLYQPSDVKIVAFNNNGVGGSPLRLSGVQAEVDVTGKASDVLRRIKVRIPLLSNSTLVPGYALTSNGSICKRFSTGPSFFSIPNDIIDPDASNDMCTAVTFAPPPPPSGPVACTENVDLSLVTDVSSSMDALWEGQVKIDVLKDVATDFVNAVPISSTGVHVDLVAFGFNATLVQQLTSSRAQLVSAIAGLPRNGGTRFLPPLNLSQAELTSSRARADAQKIIVFISDGQAHDDDYDPRILATTLKAQGFTIYTIGIVLGPEPEDLLRDMAGNGGTYVRADSIAQFNAAVQSIRSALNC